MIWAVFMWFLWVLGVCVIGVYIAQGRFSVRWTCLWQFFFYILTTHNDAISYVKHGLDPLYVFFTAVLHGQGGHGAALAGPGPAGTGSVAAPAAHAGPHLAGGSDMLSLGLSPPPPWRGVCTAPLRSPVSAGTRPGGCPGRGAAPVEGRGSVGARCAQHGLLSCRRCL